MEGALVHSDSLRLKRTRAQMQDDCVDPSSVKNEVAVLKRLHTDSVDPQDHLDDFPSLSQRYPDFLSRLGSESVETAEAAGMLVLENGESLAPLIKDCMDLQFEGSTGESTPCCSLVPRQKSDCNSYSADERARYACQFEHGFLQAADNWSADDALVDIACFLESWDDSIGEMFSAPLCLPEDYCAHASFTGPSDVLSIMDGVGEGEWCFNDVAVEAERLWIEESEQEWMGVAVASLERCSDDLERPA